MKQQLEGVVDTLIEDLKTSLEKEIAEKMSADLVNHVIESQLTDLLDSLIEKKLREIIEIGNFPQKSISHRCIDFSQFQISGDQVKGGIIANFNSAGIEDRSQNVQLTIMDKAVTFENTVFVPELCVKGTLKLDGDLIIKGSIPTDSKAFKNLVSYSAAAVKEQLNDDLFSGFSKLVSDQLQESGLDLNIIKNNGKEVVKGNQLGYHIVDTNIQRLGMVKDLQTAGETLLSGSLYVTQKRVGVNTLDPCAALVVWDEEVEIIAGKRRQDEAVIGTNRPQKVIISSNKKENLVCDTDGSVNIANLNLGKVKIGSSPSVPNFNSHMGHILFNENPSLGGPMGWVCLGGTLWANFGVID